MGAMLDGATVAAALACGAVFFGIGTKTRSIFLVLLGGAFATRGGIGAAVAAFPQRAATLGFAGWIVDHIAFATCVTVAVGLIASRRGRDLATPFVIATIGAIAAGTVAIVVVIPTSLWHVGGIADLHGRVGRPYESFPSLVIATLAVTGAIAVGVVLWAEVRKILPLRAAMFAVFASEVDVMLGLFVTPNSIGWYAAKGFAAVAASALLVAFIQELTWRRATERVAEDQAGAHARERQGDQQRLIYLAYHDELTGLFNRAHWQNVLRDRIAAAKAVAGVKDGFSVLFIDLDRFKDINDRGGHAFGDAVLNEAARRLRACVVDERSIGRLGGDEFAMICEQHDPTFLAARVGEIFRTPFTACGTTTDLGVSIGIARFPMDGESAEDLLRNADQALYLSKRGGGNSFMRYDASMAEDRRRKVSIREALGSALPNGEFDLYYQPIFDLESRRCESVEALIRWNSSTLGRLAPDAFIPVAEDTDMMREIGRFTLERAIQSLSRWHGHRGSAMPGRIAVNVSVRQLRDSKFFDHILALLREYAVDPTRLELEITESAAMADMDSAIDLLTRCRNLGLCITLDDFGTHYSSLTHLQRLPIDTIKIDKSFVQGCPGNADDVSIVRGIISLGHERRRRIVAEGIETHEQLRWLHAAGCDFGQGYLLARPMPEVDLTRRLAEDFSLKAVTAGFRIG